MKRCPECRRDYFDDSLLYCLDDGSLLLQGPGDPHGAGNVLGQENADTVLLRETDETYVFGSSQRHNQNDSIAVLPFVNISSDENAEYLSDGLAEELLHVLSKIEGLRVAGRTSSFSFKGKQTNFHEIGRLLNVSSVLEGSVRMAGRRVRVAVQLVNIADGFHRWSEIYDRTMDDIFEIQDDIAQSVVEELRSRLVSSPPDGSQDGGDLKAEVAKANKGRAEDPEAHRLLLLARHLMERRTQADTLAAREHLENALQLDPENARCWVELGNAYFFECGSAWGEHALSLAKALSASQTAISLDPGLATGHALLGKIKCTLERDFEASEISLRMAERLAPDDPFVAASMALLMLQLGRLDEALRIVRKALLSDPMNVALLAKLGYVTHAAGLLEESEMACKRLLEISPQKFGTHSYLAIVLLDRGKIDQALVEARNDPDEIWRLWATAIVAHKKGCQGDAEAALNELIVKYSHDSAIQVAEVYARFDKANKAFEWLDNAFAIGDGGLSDVKWSTNFKSLHSDPRWMPLLKKIGFPEET